VAGQLELKRSIQEQVMSYLDIPRLHFSGRFQADISTVNNDVRYYDNAGFQEKYQTMGDGGWNPEGTAIFRLVDCTITGATTAQGPITTPAQDPVIGMALENADDRVFGKLVDLDPQQQMVSQIWGMQLRLTDGRGPALVSGEFAPAAFTNLWLRQQHAVKMDQVLAALYQSILRGVVWQESANSKVLDALRQTTEDGYLAIDINVYGFGRDPAIPRYTLGRVNGTIGPYHANEPKHFVMGRQLVAALDQSPDVYPLAPANGVFTFQAKVLDDKTVAADLGNALQIVDAGGKLVDVGPLQMAVLKTDPNTLATSVAANQVAILGTFNYLNAGWYDQTAGIQDFDFSKDPWCVANIASQPLALVQPGSNNTYNVLVQETLGGLYVRADDFVNRIQAEKSAAVALYASRFGAPLSAAITLGTNTGMMGGTGAGDQPLNPPVSTPVIATPTNGATWPATLTTDSHGKAVLTVKAAALNPQYPRGYIDGQLYGIGYQLTQRPTGSLDNFWNFISVLVFSPFQAPPKPAWFPDIQPILQQFGNLYPIMSKHLVDLGDYDSVVAHLKILDLAFSLPIEDPNHMPVTRDLSEAKRDMILHWMRTPGADGLPLKGTPALAAAAPAAPMATVADVAVHLDPLQTAGKTAVTLEYQARRKAARTQ
jgi:hypothetical protein